jgi:hypothetical protein
MVDIKTLDGIGKMARIRMMHLGLGTVEAFNDYILSHAHDELQELVYAISANPRADECLEGYYPRKHNKRIMDGMIEYIKTLEPDFNMADYKTIRAPLNKTTTQVINCDVHEIGPFVSYNNSRFSRATMDREGVSYRGVSGPDTQYRYGKSCIPDTRSNAIARDQLIRNNPIYNNRRHYKCDCFLTKETCEDFAPQRTNRIINKKGKPTVAYCKWDNKCSQVD